MAVYRLLVKPSAAKEVDAIGTKRDRLRIVERIGGLAAEPQPAGCEKLAGTTALYRIRQGHYRVVFTVDDQLRILEVVKVGHRRDVYRGLK